MITLLIKTLQLPIIFALASGRPPSSVPLSFVGPLANFGGGRAQKLVTVVDSAPWTISISRRRETLVMMAKKKRKKSTNQSGNLIDSSNAKDDSNYLETKDDDDDRSNSKTSSNQLPKQTTLSGGPSLIFEMARRMLVWDDELYQGLNDAGSREGASVAKSTTGYAKATNAAIASETPLPTSAFPTSSSPLPRWRPNPILQQSISNVNPSFRTSSPIMTNAGYAGILRRNSRKKKKPSMWRHCLRVYGKMEELEVANEREGGNRASDEINLSRINAANSTTADGVATSSGRKRKKPNIQRSTPHHEAALVAASKLGMWEEAVKIYRSVEEKSLSYQNVSNFTGRGTNKKRNTVVTDNMVLSVISACVKGSRAKRTSSRVVVPENKKNDVEVVSNIPTNANKTEINFNATVSSSDSNEDIDFGKYANNDNNQQQMEPQFVPSVQTRIVMRTLSVEERRRPLDAAREIILSMEVRQDIPLVSRHINPLAAAYLRLGLRSDASELIKNHLKDRPPPQPQNNSPSKSSEKGSEKKIDQELTSENSGFVAIPLVSWSDDDDDAKLLADIDGEINEEEDDYDDYDDGYESSQLNIHQMQSKDRGSYALLVQGAVMDGDWSGAVEELKQMTEVGFYPNSRNLNAWSEGMERGCRPSGGNNCQNNVGVYYGGRRRRRSWKKKRDGIWLENLRRQ
mmetsp:Transcript_6188/g.13045  ORF Transcript_6188/g.13045 Transcript_6188/m.13045 type:complete len:686 (+) Transcript_6188:2-2059(+)